MAHVLAAGAIKYDYQPNTDHCSVLPTRPATPAGLLTWDDMQS